MAVTDLTIALAHQTAHTVTFTADGDADIERPEKAIGGISFQSDGVDGGGTLTLLVSNDGTNFVATVVNTSADPRNLTPVTSFTASGAWLVPAELASAFRYWRFHLTGSATPTLVLTVVFSHRS